MQQPVYHSREVQAWEQRWFNQQNSDYGLMQQAAWAISQRLMVLLQQQFKHSICIAVCCGVGNNAGDGYLVAKYLHQAGYSVDIYSTELGDSASLVKAYREANTSGIDIFSAFEFHHAYDVYIDALFGIGLNRTLDEDWQTIIHSINRQSGFKVAIDIPSGLHANTGQVLPCAVKADITYTVLGLKAGLLTGQGKEYASQVEVIPLIPIDDELKTLAYLSPKSIQLPKREAFGHKGSYGHVLIVGGHADMGGAVMMAAEAAFSAGAGKVSIVCDAKHHMATLARSPNIMLRDINALDHYMIQQLINQVDAVSFGMGLGRDAWSEQQFLNWFLHLNQSKVELVLDADALWFLALHPVQLKTRTYATPHPGEAAKLLDKQTSDVESDRIQAIYDLQQRYAGEWVLKGAGSLILQDKLWMCTAGNAGMATGGMGDVLAGMIASLKAQFHEQIELHQIVTLHALAGDHLAKSGMRGVQAHHMNEAVYHVVNHALEI
ncbi:NAD(P)H-hydrate dehydratase [Acinetobacter sp. 194]|uniref:NAD(P)H-hydrate dehydratase n=1 Tax=Acinetobacter shaoyimingii TaxID=2715164 RepID=UPI00140A709B|nr:NAD(P)H-hydrate dehydratase [Acinetobacter shaoyimingii]NHB57269.1 NAD(P)H-hydrate dehydratase [Acinetobacter shaoyimingii]